MCLKFVFDEVSFVAKIDFKLFGIVEEEEEEEETRLSLSLECVSTFKDDEDAEEWEEEEEENCGAFIDSVTVK